MRWLTVVVLFCACGANDDPCGEPQYGGKATDEAWRTMVDGEAHVTAGDPQAVTITAPTEGQAVSGGAGPLLLSWTSPLAAKPLALLPHLAPVTGDIYLVSITVPGRSCPLERLTTDRSWQLESGDWDTMRSASGGTLSVQITSAYLTENRITEGPYRPAAARKFTIGP